MTEKYKVIFNDRMGQIPEMSEAVKFAKENPQKVTGIINAYKEVMGLIVHMVGRPDWQEIEEISKEATKRKLKKAKGTELEESEVSKIDGKNIFIKKLGVERLSAVRNFLNQEFIDTEEAEKGAQRVVEMMEHAHQKFAVDPNWKPVDGDPDSDEVIWGQVAIEKMVRTEMEKSGNSSPEASEAKMAIAIGHFISQMIYQKFPPQVNEKWEKDDFLSITVPVAYVALKYSSYLSSDVRELIHSWFLRKPGDLGWITPEEFSSAKNSFDQQAVEDLKIFLFLSYCQKTPQFC